MASKRRPRGYWNNFANLEAELRAFVDEHGEPGMMPTTEQLRAADHAILIWPINLYGGITAVAQRLGLATLRKPQRRRNYWLDFDNVKRELLAFIERQGEPGVMPTQAEMHAAGRFDLCHAMLRHGGEFQLAEQLGLRMARPRKPKGYWDAPGRLEEELLAYIVEHGTPGVLPYQQELERDGRSDLVHAIRLNGGSAAVAQRLGLAMRPVGRRKGQPTGSGAD